MVSLEEMSRWNYRKAWSFFTKYSVGRYIPETEAYVRSLTHVDTIDLRTNIHCDARELIFSNIKPRSLILVDGGSLNGKTTFSKRLAERIDAEIVDIDLICKDYFERELNRTTDPFQRTKLIYNIDNLTDIYLLENLERIIKSKSKKSVILVGSYMEVIYRSIIARVFGKYFEQVISIYFCAKNFKEILMMNKKRAKEFGFSLQREEEMLANYNYSQRLLINNGNMLGYGMDASFIADIHVSDLFE